MASISDVIDLISSLPKTLIDAMRRRASVIVGTAAPIVKVLNAMKQPFAASATMIQYMAKQGAGIHGASAQLRQQLGVFISGLNNCISQANTLTKTVSANIPAVGVGSTFATDLVTSVLGQIPDIALLPVAKALNERPGWETKPNAIAQVIGLLIPKVASPSPQDQKDVDVWFVEVLTGLKMINTLFGLVIRLLPRDLNAGVNVVGEGGTLTLTGHPVAWFFVLGSATIDEVSTALSGVQQLIKLDR